MKRNYSCWGAPLSGEAGLHVTRRYACRREKRPGRRGVQLFPGGCARKKRLDKRGAGSRRKSSESDRRDTTWLTAHEGGSYGEKKAVANSPKKG